MSRISFYWVWDVEELSSSSDRQEVAPFVVPSGVGCALSNSNQQLSLFPVPVGLYLHKLVALCKLGKSIPFANQQFWSVLIRPSSELSWAVGFLPLYIVPSVPCICFRSPVSRFHSHKGNLWQRTCYRVFLSYFSDLEFWTSAASTGFELFTAVLWASGLWHRVYDRLVLTFRAPKRQYTSQRLRCPPARINGETLELTIPC